MYGPFTKGVGGSESRVGGDIYWQDTLFFAGRVYQEDKGISSSDRGKAKAESTLSEPNRNRTGQSENGGDFADRQCATEAVFCPFKCL